MSVWIILFSNILLVFKYHSPDSHQLFHCGWWAGSMPCEATGYKYASSLHKL